MSVIWGTKKWQCITAIVIIFIFGYGTYAILTDIFAGHPIWWYNASLILFALTGLGLLLLVRQGWIALRNIATHGFNPSSRKLASDEVTDLPREFIDDIDAYESETRTDEE